MLYTVHVSAISYAGLSTLTNTSLIIDRTPPVIGSLTDGARAPTDLSCLAREANPGCTWSGVIDPESGVLSVEWAIGTSPHGFDVQSFTAIDLYSAKDAYSRSTVSSSGEMATSSALPPGTYLFCTLRVTNGAGAVTIRSSDGMELQDIPCGVGPTSCAIVPENLFTCPDGMIDNCGCNATG